LIGLCAFVNVIIPAQVVRRAAEVFDYYQWRDDHELAQFSHGVPHTTRSLTSANAYKNLCEDAFALAGYLRYDIAICPISLALSVPSVELGACTCAYRDTYGRFCNLAAQAYVHEPDLQRELFESLLVWMPPPLVLRIILDR
jgi:hypothetical protein